MPAHPKSKQVKAERGLGAAEALAAVGALVKATRVVLVGGQSLNVWAEKYRRKGSGLEELAPFESEDIDFLGSASDVGIAEGLLRGKARFPGPDHVNTPEVGVVEFLLGGKRRRIDFLGYLAGLKRSEVEKAAVTLEIGGLSLRVMHPLDVLRSRIANIIQLRRRDPLALRQLQVSIHTLAAYIRELAEKQPRKALGIVEAAFHEALSRNAHRLWHEHGVDIAAVLGVYEGLPRTYAVRRLPQMKREVEKRRERYKARRAKLGLGG